MLYYNNLLTRDVGWPRELRYVDTSTYIHWGERLTRVCCQQFEDVLMQMSERDVDAFDQNLLTEGSSGQYCPPIELPMQFWMLKM